MINHGHLKYVVVIVDWKPDLNMLLLLIGGNRIMAVKSKTQHLEEGVQSRCNSNLLVKGANLTGSEEEVIGNNKEILLGGTS